MQGLATVFGGSGFIGRHIVRALARRGLRVRVAVRRPSLAYRLPVLGDVGQIEIVQANVRDDESVARALDGARLCVNCVAVLHEAGRQTFDALHVEGAGRVAKAAKVASVERLVHLSAIGAAADSPSAYARTKAGGEAATRAAFPSATVLRPSVVFGQEDSFFNRFGAMATQAPALPLIGGGQTRFQPVFVSDVAKAVAESLIRPEAPDATFELGGPGVYTFEALMRLMLGIIDRKTPLVTIPFGAARTIGTIGDVLSRTGLFAPPLTVDQVELLRSDNVVGEGVPGLADLGVTATALEAILPTYLFRYRDGGQYADGVRAALPSAAA
jgi:NADH dehydrogenase